MPPRCPRYMLQIVDRSVNSLISNWKTLDVTFVPWSASGSATEVPRVPVEAEDDEAEETETASKGKTALSTSGPISGPGATSNFFNRCSLRKARESD